MSELDKHKKDFYFLLLNSFSIQEDELFGKKKKQTETSGTDY